MRAQVTTVEASPARLDDAIRFFREQVLPRLRQMDGFEEFIVLSARRSGKLLGVALWESEEALRATAEDDSGGSGAANAAGGTVVSVEEYEDFVNEAPSAGPLGAITGTVGRVTDTVGGATDTLLGGAERRKASEGRATSTDASRGEGRDR